MFKFFLNIFNFFCLKLIVKFAKCFLLMFRDYRYVENYPGYIISNFGEVFSTKRGSGKQLKANPRNGYLSIGLYKNGKGKNHTIHALVGNAFIGLRNGEITFDHIDRDKSINNVVNLRWATPSENQQNTGLSKNNKLKIKNISYDESRNRYVFSKTINGNIHRKCFKTKEEAIAYKDEYLSNL